MPQDLQKRAHLTTLREGDVFVAVLSVVKAKRSDSGRYTCHPVGVDPVDLKAQSETFPCVHIFISCTHTYPFGSLSLSFVYIQFQMSDNWLSWRQPPCLGCTQGKEPSASSWIRWRASTSSATLRSSCLSCPASTISPASISPWWIWLCRRGNYRKSVRQTLYGNRYYNVLIIFGRRKPLMTPFFTLSLSHHRLISRRKVISTGRLPTTGASPFVIPRAASTGAGPSRSTARAPYPNGPSTVFSSSKVLSYYKFLFTYIMHVCWYI